VLVGYLTHRFDNCGSTNWWQLGRDQDNVRITATHVEQCACAVTRTDDLHVEDEQPVDERFLRGVFRLADEQPEAIQRLTDIGKSSRGEIESSNASLSAGAHPNLPEM
jgi:hypothetical protein